MGILSLVPGGVKLALVAALAVAAGLFYWHYTTVKGERDAAIAEVGSLRAAIEVQDATIDAQNDAITLWKEQAAAFQVSLRDMAETQAEANATARRLNDVLSRHDLHALSLAKPGLIERRINSGTADVLSMFEQVTSGNSGGTR